MENFLIFTHLEWKVNSWIKSLLDFHSALAVSHSIVANMQLNISSITQLYKWLKKMLNLC